MYSSYEHSFLILTFILYGTYLDTVLNISHGIERYVRLDSLIYCHAIG